MALYGKDKYIFIHIYKCGGVSMRNYLYGQNIEYQEIGGSHITASQLKYKMKTDGNIGIWDNVLKFTFVRNPFDWVVSLYEFIRNNIDHLYYEEVNGLSFHEFCLWNKTQIENNRSNINGIFSTQSDFIYDNKGNMLLDYVGKVENYQNDFNNILGALGLNLDVIPCLNKSNRYVNYRTYYNQDTKRMVYKTFEKDIFNFNYSFD